MGEPVDVVVSIELTFTLEISSRLSIVFRRCAMRTFVVVAAYIRGRS
jgi:hypothetical protein